MAYTPTKPCPTCGAQLRHDDRDGSDWECRHCRTMHRTAEVVLG